MEYYKNIRNVMISAKNWIVLMIAVITVVSSAGIIKATAAQTTDTADSTSIRKQLEERDQEIKDLLGAKGTEYTQNQRDRLKDIINNIVDYRAMAAKALRVTYDTLSSEKRDDFVDLFSRVVRDQSLNKLDIYRADITYNKISVNGDSAYVKTMARLEDTRTPVYYTMHMQEDEWMITDMIIDEVSTVSSYRRSFQNIIRKKGFETLMETLRKRVED